MKLLLDSDTFCKLAVADLLSAIIQLVGASLSDCARLPALPHMLRRGSLPRAFGVDNCLALLPLAESLPSISEPNPQWLEVFATVPNIDPGEALLLAVAADGEVLLLSGDKRAMRALPQAAGALDALQGKIVTVEAVLIALHERLGADELRARVSRLRPFDKTAQVCFSDGNADPLAALWSYYNSLCSEVAPLSLWHPEADQHR